MPKAKSKNEGAEKTIKEVKFDKFKTDPDAKCTMVYSKHGVEIWVRMCGAILWRRNQDGFFIMPDNGPTFLKGLMVAADLGALLDKLGDPTAA
jgi:predicted alpha-1,6-mannanase (GH76 family)